MEIFKKLMKKMKKEKSVESELEKLLALDDEEKLDEDDFGNRPGELRKKGNVKFGEAGDDEFGEARDDEFGEARDDEFGEAEDDEFGTSGEGIEDYSKFLQNNTGQYEGHELEKGSEEKTDKTDLLKGSFEDELLDELKKEDLANTEEQYNILKILDGDINAEELAGELKEIIREIGQC